MRPEQSRVGEGKEQERRLRGDGGGGSAGRAASPHQRTVASL